MTKKEIRINAANETIQTFKNGYYSYENKKIDIETRHENSMNNIKLYRPTDFENIKLPVPKHSQTNYSLTDKPVVSAIKETFVAASSNIGVLNFASAKNAGGGFLNGALAQEESLAMCSNLYLTQIKNQEYYDSNRASGTMLYTDHMIYSKDVIFIRENENEFFENPVAASVLTAPAVNMGEYLKRENSDLKLANHTLKNRMRKILQVFANENNSILILGAYGCGVFRNDPKIVARFFVDILKNEEMEKYFEKIIFSVFDNSKDKHVFNAFESELINLV